MSWVVSTMVILASLWVGTRLLPQGLAILEQWLVMPPWVSLAATLLLTLALAVALFLAVVPLLAVPSRERTIDRVVFYGAFALFLGYAILAPVSYHDVYGPASTHLKKR